MTQALPNTSTGFICRVLGVARSALYRPQPGLPTTRSGADALLIVRIKELIVQHRTFGYRRIWARVRFGDQHVINKKKVWKLPFVLVRS